MIEQLSTHADPQPFFDADTAQIIRAKFEREQEELERQLRLNKIEQRRQDRELAETGQNDATRLRDALQNKYEAFKRIHGDIENGLLSYIEKSKQTDSNLPLLIWNDIDKLKRKMSLNDPFCSEAYRNPFSEMER